MSALHGIEELQLVELTGEAPDISAPWRQLQLQREGRVDSFTTPEQAVEGEQEQMDDEQVDDELIDGEQVDEEGDAGA
jgi:hypothetical protein